MVRYQFNPTRLREMAIAHGYTIPKKSESEEDQVNMTALANAMGLSISMVSRMLSENREPGGKGMIGLRRVFPHLDVMYFFDRIVTDEECQRVTAESPEVA
ncbi:MAG: hypothetical protein ACYDCO_13680 [Armatimonadota bacterium]